MHGSCKWEIPFLIKFIFSKKATKIDHSKYMTRLRHTSLQNTSTKAALQQLHSNSFNLVKKFPMCRILIFADIRPMGVGFHAVVVFGLGKNF